MENSTDSMGRDRRFAELARSGPDVILITDAGGRVERAWGATERLLGAAADALPGRALRELLDRADWPGFEQYFAACRNEPRTRRYFDARSAAASTWCELETFNNRHDDPTHLQLAFRLRDVTPRYAARDMLAEESARQRAAEQMNEVLNAILVQTAEIKRLLPNDPDRARAVVAEIERIIGRATKPAA